MAYDPFDSVSDSIIAPARDAFAITPDNNAGFARATRAIYVGTGGDMVARLVGAAEDVTFRNVSAGSVLAVRLTAVRASGTTAEDLVGLA